MGGRAAYRAGVVIVAGTALVAAHLQVEPLGRSAVGGLVVLDHGYDLVVSLALLALCLAVGGLVLRPFHLPGITPAESLLFALPLGAGAVAVGLLLLGAAGGFRPVPLAIALGLAALAARHELARIPRLAAQAFSPREAAPTDLGILAVLVMAGAGGFLVLFALAPPVDWDALVYHLRIPADFVAAGRVYQPEDTLRVSYINVIQTLYVPLLAAGSESGPAVLGAAFALFLGLAVHACCVRWLPGPTAGFATATLWASTTLLVVAITPRVDVTLALFLFLAHYALLVAWAERDRRWFCLVGALLGLAAAVKYQALPYGLALAPLVIWAAIRARAGARHFATAAAAGLAGLAPWLVKNWVFLGAPLYPVLSPIKLTPWLASMVGSRDLPPNVHPDLTRIIWSSRAPFSLRDAFLAPERISIEYEGRYYLTNPALLIAPLGLLLRRTPVIPLLLLPALAYLVILLVPYPDTNIRYLLPAVPPLTIVAAHLLTRAAERWLRVELAAGALVIAAVALLSPTIRTARLWLDQTLAVEHLLGRRTGRDFAENHLLPRVRQFAPMVQYLNDSLPQGSRVLMLFEDRGYGLVPSVVEDQNAMTWPLLAHRPASAQCLRGTRLTHVLVGEGAVHYYVDGGADSTVLELPSLRAFTARCLALVRRETGHALYRLAP